MIVCRSRAEIEKLRRVNQLVAQVLAELRQMAGPGVTTADIDRVAEERVRAAGAEPAFKGYHGYPATVCVSANEQVVHGIPSNRALVEGDILSIDMGARLDGFFGDSAVTVPIGTVSPEAQALLKVTEEAHGFSVVREFVGHGIGTALHEEPQIANYGPGGRGPRLAEGMVLAIEPMVNAGKPAVKVLADGWTAVTRDGSLSAHFEHTVVVTAEGCEILTLLPAETGRAKQLLSV
jgi:methionyl aminopeptidase